VRDSGHVRKLAADRLRVETLRVAAHNRLQRTIDEHLDEWHLVRRAHVVSRCTIRRNGRHNGDDAIPGEQSRNESDPPHVLIAILAREVESPAQRGPNLIAIQNFHLKPASHQLIPYCTCER
jgi:hypothetical protein